MRLATKSVKYRRLKKGQTKKKHYVYKRLATKVQNIRRRNQAIKRETSHQMEMVFSDSDAQD